MLCVDFQSCEHRISLNNVCICANTTVYTRRIGRSISFELKKFNLELTRA